MLDSHRIDMRIIRAIKANRNGLTTNELHRELEDDGEGQISDTAIKRHLPGLLQMKCIRGIKCVREDRMVTVWLIENFAEVRSA